jgi:hypothetical protein
MVRMLKTGLWLMDADRSLPLQREWRAKSGWGEPFEWFALLQSD